MNTPNENLSKLPPVTPNGRVRIKAYQMLGIFSGHRQLVKLHGQVPCSTGYSLQRVTISVAGQTTIFHAMQGHGKNHS